MHRTITCFACGNGSLTSDKESGEVICSYCGVVVIERIESPVHYQIKSQYSDTDTSAGPRYSLSSRNKGFSTTMARHSYGDNAPPVRTAGFDFERIRVWDSRIRSSHDRGWEKGLSELGRLRELLALPDAVTERAAYFFRKSADFGITKGRTVASVMAASVYLACREADIPKTLDEIATACNISRKRLAKDYRVISRMFDVQLPVTDIPRCVTKLANIMGISESRKRRAIELVSSLSELGVSAGKSPLGLAAAVLYLICKDSDEEKTQVDLAHAAGVTEVTIRNRCRELLRLVASNKIPRFGSFTTFTLVSVHLAMVANALRSLPAVIH